MHTVEFNLDSWFGLWGSLASFCEKISKGNSIESVIWTHLHSPYSKPNICTRKASIKTREERTCCHAFTFLIRGKDLSVSQSCTGNILYAEAEHRVCKQKLWNCSEVGTAFFLVL